MKNSVKRSNEKKKLKHTFILIHLNNAEAHHIFLCPHPHQKINFEPPTLAAAPYQPLTSSDLCLGIAGVGWLECGNRSLARMASGGEV